MGSVVSDIGEGIGGLWNDVTGKTQRDAQGKANASQMAATNMANKMGAEGAGNTGAATNYWNQWMNDPAAAYSKTLGTAQNVGGANAGMATNNAVNAARGSGLNAGQAALAGGAQAANAFTEGTQNAQNSLINTGMQSAQGQSNQGVNLQNSAVNTLGNIAGQQQQQAQNKQGLVTNILGGIL